MNSATEPTINISPRQARKVVQCMRNLKEILDSRSGPYFHPIPEAARQMGTTEEVVRGWMRIALLSGWKQDGEWLVPACEIERVRAVGVYGFHSARERAKARSKS